MAEREYTDAQKTAIKDRDHTLLVSAAAGSGKTTVLIDRIVGIVTDETKPVELDRLLVVTYTKAAAAEIRDRLSVALGAALAKNPTSKRLLRQLAMVPNAKIDTMDAFFLDVIRKNFDKAGLPAGFSVCDEGTSDVLLTSACEELMEEYYESKPQGSVFYRLVENLSSAKSDAGLGKALKQLYREVFSFAEPEDYLTLCVSEYERLASGELDYTESSFYKAIKDDISIKTEHVFDNIREAWRIVEGDDNFKNYVPSIEKLYSSARSFSSAKNYDELYKAVSGYSAVKLSSVKNVDPEAREFVKSARADGNALFEELCELFCLSTEELRLCCKEYAELAAIIKELLIGVDEKFTRLKKSKGFINFADMKRICYGLLFDKENGVRRPSAIAADIAKDYKEIFIDEYQDTDGIQDDIFAALAKLSGANRFMVGDMKQCVYAFRGSEPKLFAGYYDAFPDHGKSIEKNARIILADNFRSDNSVIKTTNLIFSSLMRKRISDIDYDEAQALKKGKNTDIGVPAEIFITKLENKEKTEEATRLQAKSCALEISRLINEEGYAPKDIAILTRFNSQLPVYKRALEQLGIDTKSADKTDVFKTAEVMLVRAVLYAVDNPARDVSLASALCSPVFGLTLTELAELRLFKRGSLYEALCLSENDKAVRAVEYLKELKRFSLSNGIDKLIFKIIKESGLDRAVKREKGGKKRYQNLLRFITLSKTYNGGSYRGLSDFLSYCESLERASSSSSADESGVGVTVSSMHKSKGLEYKVCFVASCEKDLFSGNHVEYTHGSGVSFAFPLLRQNGFVKVEPPPYAAIDHLNRYKPVSEELRLLYVALTRAKERLYISFAVDGEKLDKMLDGIDSEQKPASDYFVLNGRSHLEFILRGIAAGRGESLEKIFYADNGVGDFIRISYAQSGEQTDKTAEKAPTVKSECEVYPDYVYPFAKRALIPAKISVSDLDGDGEREFPKTKGELPSFMSSSAASSAQKGTAMHNFMQFCDYENAELDVRAEAKRLAELGFISRAQEELLSPDELEGFFKSELYKKMKRARRIYREQRYNLSQSASKYYESDAAKGQTLLIQGVIDCFFEDENGDMILVDFKTDRVPREGGEQILRERHTPQLLLYAEAVELMLTKKLSRAYVYSFALGREIVCIEGGAYAT